MQRSRLTIRDTESNGGTTQLVSSDVMSDGATQTCRVVT